MVSVSGIIEGALSLGGACQQKIDQAACELGRDRRWHPGLAVEMAKAKGMRFLAVADALLTDLGCSRVRWIFFVVLCVADLRTSTEY